MHEGVYRKTDAGREEIRVRGRRLSVPLRATLLMVDGRRTLPELRRLASSVRAPGDALESLFADGLIEVDAQVPVQPPEPVRPVAPVAAATTPPAPITMAATPAAIDHEAPMSLYQHLSLAVRSHLGMGDYVLQLRLDRCGDEDELRALLPDLHQALVKAKGEEFANDWLRSLASHP